VIYVTEAQFVLKLSIQHNANGLAQEGHMPYGSYYSYYFQPRELRGGSGNDSLSGFYGNDRLFGGHGHDYLFGNAGIDFLDGEWGNDYLDGGADSDQMMGGAGYDILFGGEGNDWIAGDGGWNDGDYTGYWGDGWDLLYGGAGKDTLIGNGGNDVLRGGADADYLWGGYGGDTFAFNFGDSFAQTGRADVIRSWDHDDRIGGARGGYAEFSANVYSIEDAQWYANIYQAVGWLPYDTGNVLIYNQATHTGYLMMDLDNDAHNSFESGVEIKELDHWEIGQQNIVLV
jgi:Ca2+-binding RTX toxin-like protein